MIASSITCLFAYAVVRAITVSFSYDECFTFLEHVSKDRFYQTQHDQMGGNHHLLNVWLMWLSWKLFGNGELALRLPNLLAYALYLYAAGRIALRSANALLAIAVFLALNLHPYLIDFFSLARGYGLGHAFVLLSLWQAMRYTLDGQERSALVWASVCAALAALAHVIMINYALAFGAAMGIFLLARGRAEGRAPWKPLLTLAGILLGGLIIILPNALGLFHGGSLNFGCERLWECSMRSLAEKLVYHLPYKRAPLVYLEKALWWCAGAWALSAVLAWRLGGLRGMRPAVFGMLVLWLCVLAFVLQAWLFGVPLPLTRTTLFLVPIAAFTVASAMQAWPRWSWAAGMALSAGCVPLVLLCHDAFNTAYAVEWKATGEVRRALEIVMADHPPLSDARPAVVVRDGFETEGSMRYYMANRNWHHLQHGMRGDTAFQSADYYLVEYDAHHLVDARNWTRVFQSAATGLELYRDERLRREPDTVVHRSNFRDASHEEERFPMLLWTAPEDWRPGPVRIIGTAYAREESAENWVGLMILVRREGRLIAEESRPSHEQIATYGDWNEVRVMAHVRHDLLPGDVVEFSARPCFPSPPIELGGAALVVLR